jgi:hypothetical protein
LLLIRYNDRDPWPESADGGGYSLVPKALPIKGDLNDPANWKLSETIHGSPGKDDGATTDVEQSVNRLPEQFQLHQNYPNPFNNATVINYTVGVNGHSPVQVELSVYNVLGQKVATLVSGRKQAGRHQVEWHAEGFASGLYFYRLQADAGFVQTKKMLLIR